MSRKRILAEVIDRLKRSRQLEHHDKPRRRKHPFLHEELEGISPHKDWETRFELDPEPTELDSRIYNP